MAIRTPPLRDYHEEQGAKFTEFNGWDMPVEFDSIQSEHTAVRETVGKFDVSHMGEIEVLGPDATSLMQRLTTNDVTALDPGDAQYSMIPDEDGNIIDDTVIYHLPESADVTYLFVPNAGNDEEIYSRWISHRDQWDLDATVRNVTDSSALFAIQGPEATQVVTSATENSVTDLSKFEGKYEAINDTECWISRTGYTGEDGYEILVPWGDAESVWQEFNECQACGLGARDTLRIEMGYLLSGQDFDSQSNPRNPYEARVGFTVKLDTEFVGRDTLEQVAAEGPEEKFVGVKLIDRGIPRNGYEIINEENHIIGSITSGTMSPTLDEPIGLGYVPTEYAEEGQHVGITIRGERKKAKIVIPPFLEGY
ncbi:MAG: glycine cleavage system aminomethyltransferase GcvT [Halobacteriaceae archaeon]